MCFWVNYCLHLTRLIPPKMIPYPAGRASSFSKFYGFSWLTQSPCSQTATLWGSYHDVGGNDCRVIAHRLNEKHLEGNKTETLGTNAVTQRANFGIAATRCHTGAGRTPHINAQIHKKDPALSLALPPRGCLPPVSGTPRAPTRKAQSVGNNSQAAAGEARAWSSGAPVKEPVNPCGAPCS